MNRLPLVYNPGAGPAALDPDRLLARLPAEIRSRLELVRLERPFDYRPVVERALRAGGPLLVWGGDGTVHHAGRALVELGCPLALAAVPGGSGNGLVRGLATPLDPAGAVQRLLEGRDLAVDLARLDGIPFFNLCGAGFEAAVAAAFDSAGGHGLGTYAAASFRLWRGEPQLRLQWQVQVPEAASPGNGRMARLRAAWHAEEPQALPDTAWSLCFANLPQYGSGLWIAPEADPTDGALDWVRLRRPNPLELVTQVPQLFRERGRTSLRRQGRILAGEVRFETVAPWHLDGEPAEGRDRAELTLEPRAFRLRVSPECPWE